MKVKWTAIAVTVGIAMSVGVPATAAHAGSGTSPRGVYEISVKPDKGTVFDKPGITGTMRVKMFPSAQGSWRADQWDTDSLHLTLPAGMQFASGAERGAACTSTWLATITCRMEPNRRNLYIDTTYPRLTSLNAPSDPWLSVPVVSKGRITGTARAIYHPLPKLSTNAPCRTTYVPTDVEPESFDVVKAFTKTLPGVNLDVEDLTMDVRSYKILDRKVTDTERMLVNLLDGDNRTAAAQTWSTLARSQTVTTSASFTHENKTSTAAKLGSSMKVTLAGILEASVSAELNYGEDFTNGRTHTTTHSETVTYPSQTLVVPAGYHGRLDYMMTKSSASGKIEATGVFTGKVGVTGCLGGTTIWMSAGNMFAAAAKAGALPSRVRSNGEFILTTRYTADAAVKEYINAETWPVGAGPTSKKAVKSTKLVKANRPVTLK